MLLDIILTPNCSKKACFLSLEPLPVLYYSLKVSYADMDSSVVEEREVKRKRMGIITREEWEVGQQVWIVIATYPGDSHPDGVYVNAGQGDMTG